MGEQPDPFMVEVGRRIRRRRDDLQLYQADVARRIGMTAGQLSNLESGRHARMQLRQLRALALVLETTVDYLLQLSEERGPIPPRRCPGAQLGATRTLCSQSTHGASGPVSVSSASAKRM